MTDTDRLNAELVRAIQDAANAGAQVACIGGGLLSGARQRIGARSWLPLIEPVRAAAELIAVSLEN
ncbi:hypothetical protein [Breoghania sp.]|uniref:hypothetical protein n=1 Tax=Breoghania sp. TaxID=2065378 RepID=UPI00262A4AE2|nr:hypothetical protein [Breoghania sp.]MDJ0933229.1 hypothetical protein [Breoghania sp.]